MSNGAGCSLYVYVRAGDNDDDDDNEVFRVVTGINVVEKMSADIAVVVPLIGFAS
jgi:hypothetical protein